MLLVKTLDNVKRHEEEKKVMKKKFIFVPLEDNDLYFGK